MRWLEGDPELDAERAKYRAATGGEADVERHLANGQIQDGPTLVSRALFWPDLKKLPPTDYVVKGIIDRGSFGEIYEPHSSGKSFLASDIGLHVAAGWTWQNHRVRQGGVLYVSAEGGVAIVKRLDAFARHHHVNLDELPFAVVLAPTNLLDRVGVAQVIADASRLPNLALIEIDTAARVMPGGREDTEDMGAFVAACDRIRAETSAALLAVHHTGKEVGRGSRGSSVLPAAIDMGMSVTKDATTKIATAELVKVRDGAEGETFSFRLNVVDLGTDNDGDPSCTVEYTHETTAKTKRLSDAQGRALKLLADAIDKGGEIPPATDHIPGNIRCVTGALWREYCYRGGISATDTQDAKKKAFARAAEALMGAGRVGKWEPFVWIV